MCNLDSLELTVIVVEAAKTADSDSNQLIGRTNNKNSDGIRFWNEIIPYSTNLLFLHGSFEKLKAKVKVYSKVYTYI